MSERDKSIPKLIEIFYLKKKKKIEKYVENGAYFQCDHIQTKTFQKPLICILYFITFPGQMEKLKESTNQNFVIFQ